MFDVFVISAIQGITEFLPISSHAHLIIFRSLLGIAPHFLIIDIAAHFGTLCASLVYFRKDMGVFFRQSFSFVKNQLNPFQTRQPMVLDDEASKLTLFLILASLPIVILGALLFFTQWIEFLRAHLFLIIIVNSVFALFLFWADRQAQRKKTFAQMGFLDMGLIGLGQACALMPGASRAGCVMTMARFLSFERVFSARLAFFLAIPSIFGAVLLGSLAVHHLTDMRLVLAAMGFSFIFGLLILSGFLKLSRFFSFNLFVIYRLGLSAFLFVFYYW